MSPSRKIIPFRRGALWWARVPRLEGKAVQRSLGTEDSAVAQNTCEFLRWLRARNGHDEAYLLDEMASGKLAVAVAYQAYLDNRLETFVRDRKHGVQDVDLEPFVGKWQKELERRKRPNPRTRGAYLVKVRRLIPEGVPFRRSQFTRQRIREHLSALARITQPNRHRSALSSFAEYLLFEDVIPSNPVRQVPMAREAQPRTLHLSQADAKRLLPAISEEYRAVHALMLATGMEVSAALAVRRADLDLAKRTVYARGTKRAHRERTCFVYDRWSWAWQIVALHITNSAFLPTAKLFDGLDAEASLDALRSALKATELPAAYRQHDHRHTWAVESLRDGIPLHAVAHQLGHRDAVMTLRVYGRFIPQSSDFRIGKADEQPEAEASHA